MASRSHSKYTRPAATDLCILASSPCEDYNRVLKLVDWCTNIFIEYSITWPFVSESLENLTLLLEHYTTVRNYPIYRIYEKRRKPWAWEMLRGCILLTRAAHVRDQSLRLIERWQSLSRLGSGKWQGLLFWSEYEWWQYVQIIFISPSTMFRKRGYGLVSWLLRPE